MTAIYLHNPQRPRKLGSDNIDALIGRALSSHRNNLVDEAESLYNQILVLDPQNADALHLKGAIAIQRGDYRRAVDLISRAIIERPDQAAFYSNLAVALQKLGIADKAKQYAEKSLLLKMDSAEPYIVLGQTSLADGNIEAALEKFKIALKLQPNNVAAELGILQVFNRDGRLQDAEQFIELRIGQVNARDELLIKLAHIKIQLKKAEDAVSLLERCKHKAGHDWHVQCMKAKIELKRYDEARIHGREVLAIKDKLAELVAHDIDLVSIHQKWPSLLRPFDATAPHRNIICFSLWGNDQKYTYTAVLNAKLVPSVYPGWKARFYIDNTVPAEIAQALRDYGAQVILVQNDGRTYLKLFWRFLVASDASVDYFVCRDCDAVVNHREKAAVDEWLASGKPFHIMRDHPEHAELIMAGMWGGVAGLLPNLAEEAVRYYETHETKWRWVDQDFLRDRVWTVIKNHTLTHDGEYLFGSDAHPFPEGSELPEGDHVGGYHPVTWRVRET
jgi:tetratricopeptide (TPR) repeat protein